MPGGDRGPVVSIYGLPAVLVEQPGGDALPYLIAETVGGPHELRAFTLTRPAPDAAGKPVTYRVARTRWFGWVCTCRDWALRGRRNRRGGYAADCKHLAAVKAHLDAKNDPAQANILENASCGG